MSTTDKAPAATGMKDRIEAVLAKTPTGLLINGQWRDASDGGTFEVENPATEEVIAEVPDASADPVSIDWKTLGALDYVNGKVPANLQALNGKLVKIPGFIVPLEDYEEEGAEFLLVPYFGACVHTPPPPPNQMVFVRMEGGKKLKFGWWDPVWMEGTLKIEHYDSPYGAVGFQLVGTTTSPYAPK